MQLSDFHYDLPAELIALYPAKKRSHSRLLCLDASTAAIEHKRFTELTNLLNPEDLLVFNDTRVIPARLFGFKESGGKVELLIERLMENNRLLAQVKCSKPLKPGGILFFGESADDFESAACST